MSLLANQAWAQAATLALALSVSCAAASAQTSSKKERPNQPPTVLLTASPNHLCYGGEVKLLADAKDPDGDKLAYAYRANSGRIVGKGRKVRWLLSGMGLYEARVEVSDGRGGVANASATVHVFELCNCHSLSVSGSSEVLSERPIVRFDLNLSGGPVDLRPTYSWSVSAGKIIKGKKKISLLVDATGVAAEDITATVKVGGLDPECGHTGSFTVKNPARTAP